MRRLHCPLMRIVRSPLEPLHYKGSVNEGREDMKNDGNYLLGSSARGYGCSVGKEEERNKRTNRKKRKKKISFEDPVARGPSSIIWTQAVEDSTGVVQMKEKRIERMQYPPKVSGILEREKGGTGVIFQEDSNPMQNASPIHSGDSCTLEMSVCHSIPSSTATGGLVLEKERDSENGAQKVLSSMYSSFEIPSGMERSTYGEAHTVKRLKSFVPENSLGPTEEDYRALLLDLILLRRETLLPILNAIHEERQSLASQLSLLAENVKTLQEVRDDIRELLETYSTQSNDNNQRSSSSTKHLPSSTNPHRNATSESFRSVHPSSAPSEKGESLCRTNSLSVLSPHHTTKSSTVGSLPFSPSEFGSKKKEFLPKPTISENCLNPEKSTHSKVAQDEQDDAESDSLHEKGEIQF